MHLVRRAEIKDVPAIESIWRQRLTVEPPPHEAANRRFVQLVEEQNDVFQCWVLEVDGEVQGWVSLAPMRNSPSLRNTMAEVSLYLARTARGNEYGRILFEYAKQHAMQTPLEWLWAFTGKSIAGSRMLVEYFGFTQAFELPPVAKMPSRDRILVYVYPIGGQDTEAL